jgi:hypothetical protein
MNHKIVKHRVKLTRFCYTSTVQTAVRPPNVLTVWMLQGAFVIFIRKYSGRTSQRKLCTSITKTAQLMLYWEVIAVHFQIRIKHKHTHKMWAEHRDFNVTSGSARSNAREWEKEHYSVCHKAPRLRPLVLLVGVVWKYKWRCFKRKALEYWQWKPEILTVAAWNTGRWILVPR